MHSIGRNQLILQRTEAQKNRFCRLKVKKNCVNKFSFRPRPSISHLLGSYLSIYLSNYLSIFRIRNCGTCWPIERSWAAGNLITTVKNGMERTVTKLSMQRKSLQSPIRFLIFNNYFESKCILIVNWEIFSQCWISIVFLVLNFVIVFYSRRRRCRWTVFSRMMQNTLCSWQLSPLHLM